MILVDCFAFFVIAVSCPSSFEYVCFVLFVLFCFCFVLFCFVLFLSDDEKSSEKEEGDDDDGDGEKKDDGEHKKKAKKRVAKKKVFMSLFSYVYECCSCLFKCFKMFL